jgi:hypothetical protein
VGRPVRCRRGSGGHWGGVISGLFNEPDSAVRRQWDYTIDKDSIDASLRTGVNMRQRARQPHRFADDRRSRLVSAVLPCSGDRKLHEQCGERHQHHDHQAGERAGMVAFLAAAGRGEEQQVREHPDSAGDRRRNRHRWSVIALHMREFVCQYPGDFTFREHTQQAVRNRDRGV